MANERRAPDRWRAILAGSHALAVACLLMATLAALVTAGYAAASGSGTLSFTLTVDAKAALGGNAPTTIMLLSPAQFSQEQVGWTQVGQDGDVYTYSVTVPADTPPGTYEVQVLALNGGVGATSNSFEIVSSGASRGGPHSSPPLVSVPGSSTTSPAGALLIAAIALLLALAVTSLAAPMLRRPRHDAR